VLTDETRSFATHPLRPAPGGGAAWETSLPPLSLTTFVWDAESTGRMTLPEGVAVR
jgi:O-glycosyl hydrolase